MNRYVLGLDLGVASIGWGLLSLDDSDIPTSILDQGVVTFKALDNDKGKLYNQERRDARGSRRVIRRRRERNRRIRQLLCKTFNMDAKDFYALFHEVGKIQNNNVIEIKVKGLEEKLSNEELMRVLLNYSKNRGFKSNRKIEEEKEKGKMKEAIGNIQAVMVRDNCTVSKAILTYQKENNIDVIHNTNDAYIYGFERKDVEDEINRILLKQVELKVIDQEFADKYVEIWASQRDFSEGPASGPYAIESFEKAFGFCKFRTEEKRIARACPSFDVHNFLTRLQSLTYCIIDDEGNRVLDGKRVKYHSLTKEQIKELYEKVFNEKTSSKISYNYIINMLEKELNCKVDIKESPSLGKEEFNKVIKKYRDEKGITERLNDKQYEEVKLLAKKEALDKEYVSAKAYKDLKSSLLKNSNKNTDYIDIHFMDKIATILSYAQTDAAITKVINENYSGEFTDEMISVIKKVKVGTSGTGNLSLSLVQDLNELMVEGLNYTEAMKELGYDHSLQGNRATFESLFPTVKEIENAYDTMITQPNVKHTLVYLRKLYNAIVKEYGKPELVHIEVAREIKNSWSTRMQMKNDQINNQVENEKARLKMMEVLGVDDIQARRFRSFTQDDILKFRLWNEQSGYCMYTQEYIEPSQLLARNEYQVDHILPFSRTFDDSYTNKVLVKASANQEKKNQTPYEWLGKTGKWNEFSDFIVQAKKLGEEKKNKLLMKEEISYDEFTKQSLHATSYVSKLAVQIFKDLLNTDDNNDRVRPFKGNTTSYLRKYYRLNNLTHSIENIDYDRTKTEYKIMNDGISIDVTEKDASITLAATANFGQTIEHTVKVSKNDKKEFRSLEDQELYDLLANKQELYKFLEDNVIDKNIHKIEDINFFVSKERNIVIAKVVYDLVSGLKAKLIEKNRNNHFHHTVDALLVASMTRSMQMKITKFHQMWQDLDKRDYSEDLETGEIIDKNTLLSKFNIDNSQKDSRFFIPLPYDGFIDELKVKVFERNQDILIEKLKQLPHITDYDVQVKYPSYQVSKKVSGKLHAETIYGRKFYNGAEVNTIRKPVKDLKIGDLEKIYDKEAGQKTVYETLLAWIKNGKKGVPRLANGEIVKKVKLMDGNVDKMITLSPNFKQKGYAAIDSVARIQIYKKDNDDKLYFVQIAIDQYLKIKEKRFDFKVQLWWGQGKNVMTLQYSELANLGFTLYRELHPGQHIIVTMNSEAKGLCKTVGFTSGKLEVKSVLGDDLDILNAKIQQKIKSQYQISVSTIKSVDLVSITIVGNLCLFDN